MPWLVNNHVFYLDLLVSMTIDQDFPWKQGIATSFFFYLAQWSSIQEDNTDNIIFKLLQGYLSASHLHRRQDFKRRLSKPRTFVAFGKVFFLFLTKWSYFFPWASIFFVCSLPKDFFAFNFSVRVSKKSFHMGILSMIFVKYDVIT